MLVYQTSTGIEMAQNREIQYYTNMLFYNFVHIAVI